MLVLTNDFISLADKSQTMWNSLACLKTVGQNLKKMLDYMSGNCIMAFRIYATNSHLL